MIEYETVPVTASLHLHDHRVEDRGPWSLRIGKQSQPPAVVEWTQPKVLISLEQPPGDNNFTMIWVLYLRGGRRKPPVVRSVTFHNARQYLRRDGTREIRVKSRYALFPNCIPIGVYGGTCYHDPDGGLALYTFQAMTQKREPEESKPKLILTPGDEEYHGTLRDAARTLEGTVRLGEGTDEAGGLRGG